MLFERRVDYLILLIGVAELLSYFLLEKAALEKTSINIYFMVGLLLVIISYLLFYKVLKSGKEITMIHTIVDTLVAVLLGIGSYLLFEKKLTIVKLISLTIILLSTILIAVYEL